MPPLTAVSTMAGPTKEKQDQPRSSHSIWSGWTASSLPLHNWHKSWWSSSVCVHFTCIRHQSKTKQSKTKLLEYSHLNIKQNIKLLCQESLMRHIKMFECWGISKDLRKQISVHHKITHGHANDPQSNKILTSHFHKVKCLPIK